MPWSTWPMTVTTGARVTNRSSSIVRVEVDVEPREQLAVLLFARDDLDVEAEVLAEQQQGVVGTRLGRRDHLAQVEHLLDERSRIRVDPVGEVGQRGTARQPDNLALHRGGHPNSSAARTGCRTLVCAASSTCDRARACRRGDRTRPRHRHRDHDHRRRDDRRHRGRHRPAGATAGATAVTATATTGTTATGAAAVTAAAAGTTATGATAISAATTGTAAVPPLRKPPPPPGPAGRPAPPPPDRHGNRPDRPGHRAPGRPGPPGPPGRAGRCDRHLDRVRPGRHRRRVGPRQAGRTGTSGAAHRPDPAGTPAGGVMPNGLLPAPRAGGRAPGRGCTRTAARQVAGRGPRRPGAGGRAGLGLGLGVGGSTDGPACAASRLAAGPPLRRLLLSLQGGRARFGRGHLDVVCARRLQPPAEPVRGSDGRPPSPAVPASRRPSARCWRQPEPPRGPMRRPSPREVGAPPVLPPCSTPTSRTRRSLGASRGRSCSLPRVPLPAHVRGPCLPLHSSLLRSCGRPATTSVVHLKPGHFWSFIACSCWSSYLVRSRARRRSPHHRSYVRAGMPHRVGLRDTGHSQCTPERAASRRLSEACGIEVQVCAPAGTPAGRIGDDVDPLGDLEITGRIGAALGAAVTATTRSKSEAGARFRQPTQVRCTGRIRTTYHRESLPLCLRGRAIGVIEH